MKRCKQVGTSYPLFSQRIGSRLIQNLKASIGVLDLERSTSWSPYIVIDETQLLAKILGEQNGI